MTENEAIERLKCMRLFMRINDKASESKFLEEDYIANKTAIKTLEEIQQYRAIGTVEHLTDMKQNYAEALSDWRQYRKIGTVEECREARERQRAKKPIKIAPCKSVNYFKCSSCGEFLSIGKPFCKECGNAVDWSGEID